MSQLDRITDCFTSLAVYIVCFSIMKAKLQEGGFLNFESISFFHLSKDTFKIIELSGKTDPVS